MAASLPRRSARGHMDSTARPPRNPVATADAMGYKEWPARSTRGPALVAGPASRTANEDEMPQQGAGADPRAATASSITSAAETAADAARRMSSTRPETDDQREDRDVPAQQTRERR